LSVMKTTVARLMMKAKEGLEADEADEADED